MRHRPFPFLALLAEGAASAIDAFETSTLRTVLALAVVAAGVCAMLVAGAAARGVADRLRRDAARDGARGFVVYPSPGLTGRDTPLGSADARALASLPQIAGATAHQTVVLPVGAGAAVIAGATVDAYDDPAFALRDLELVRGRWFSAADAAHAAPVVALDDGLAARLAGPVRALGTQLEIAHHPFRVVGVFHDRRSGPRVILPLETARRVLGAAPAWTDVVARVRAGVRVADAAQAAAARLRDERRLGDAPADFIVAGAGARRAGGRPDPLVARRTIASLVAFALALAGLALVGVMTRAVRDRTREIGLRKMLGATRAAILLEIVAESTILAIVGGAAGLAAGRGIAMLIAGATPLPASVSAAAAIAALGITIAGGAALGAPPGLMAARLDVRRALRGR